MSASERDLAKFQRTFDRIMRPLREQWRRSEVGTIMQSRAVGMSALPFLRPLAAKQSERCRELYGSNMRRSCS